MAIRTGIKHITGEYVIIQDADLEYDPHDYSLLLPYLHSGEYSVVYGSRFRIGKTGILIRHFIGEAV